MKYLKEIGFAIVIMLIMIPVSVRAEGLGHARLSLMEGDVQIKSEDSSEWFPASINMPLRDGDSVWVPNGARAEVQLTGGTQVRLDELSALDLVNISRDSSQFYLAEGSAYINFRGGRSGSLVQVDTPTSSVRAYDRAAFGIDVSGGGNSEVSVYKGQVQAESRSGSTRVNSGNALMISDAYADLAPLGRADSWERWNMERDRRFEESRYSSRYLPDELGTYASDFDDNGKWVSVADYGYVWTPTVQVSVGWSPYRNGRWCWVGKDYVWVGYEPWGWAPYHYGRWANSASVGWFWVPPARGEVYWGPGFVGWVSTPTYVAWVPLAPRETYYGYGNYGPHSVNLINININTISHKNRYRNVQIQNAVTAVHYDTFVRGRHVDFKVRENPFLREKIHIGRPDIRPERESRMAVIRDIPRAKEPPMSIRNVKVREIRESRPMVREIDKSVFSPNRLNRQMGVKAVETPRERKREGFGERPKEPGRTFIGSERQQTPPAATRKEREGGAGLTSPITEPSQKMKQRQIEQQNQQPVQPKQQIPQPDRTKQRELRRPEEGVPAQQQMLRPKESAPIQNRQIQREEPKQQIPQLDRTKQRELRRPEEGVPAQQKMLRPKESAPVQNRAIQREEPKQQIPQPDRTKQRELRRPEEGAPAQQMLKQRESAPVQNRAIQREAPKQKQQVIQGNKVQEEKDGVRPSGEGSQPKPLSGGAPGLR